MEIALAGHYSPRKQPLYYLTRTVNRQDVGLRTALISNRVATQPPAQPAGKDKRVAREEPRKKEPTEDPRSVYRIKEEIETDILLLETLISMAMWPFRMRVMTKASNQPGDDISTLSPFTCQCAR
jgi:hypothetical protein